ncbi:hypothetical protein ACW0JT_12880 [Arthrobacter sp. SA17]
MSITQSNVCQIKLVNFYELRVDIVPTSAAETAFHLLLGREVVDKHPYSQSLGVSFFLRDPGVYRIKSFIRGADGNVATTLSEPVRFAGFRDIGVPLDQRPVVLAGINRTTAAAFHMVQGRREVVSFLDPSGQKAGGSFFERDIVAPAGLPQGAVIWAPKGFDFEGLDADLFSLETGARDALSSEVIRMGVMDMHKTSRFLYAQDLIRGATYLQNFIFHHFSCRLPYKVRLGEGTRLGYNGLGTVFHPETVVGRNCVIAQNVTLGSRGKPGDKPAIGDNVYIGPGAKCLGGKIGNNVVVGANAVVVNPVPDNCVVAGVPAKVISTDMGSYSGYTGPSA